MRLMSGSLFMKYFYYEFHYEMSIKCMIRILAVSSVEISWDSCPVHYLWSCFYYEVVFTMKKISLWNVYKFMKLFLLWISYETSIKCIQDSGHSKNYGGNFMIQYWNIMRLMSGSLFMKLFLLWISLWNVYKVHDQDSGHSKNYGGNFMVRLMSGSLIFHYDSVHWNIMRLMSGSLFMKLFLLWISLWNVYKVHDQDSGHSKKLWWKFYDSVLKYHETHVRFIIYEVVFTMNFTMKCL